MLILTHKSDLDGKASGAIVLRKFPGSTVIGMEYGQDLDTAGLGLSPTEPVVMLDFSLQPFERMVLLNTLCDLTWIDHHSSAIEEAARSGVPFKGVQSVSAAACELAWTYFFPDEPLPLAIRLLSLYDSWQHDQDPRALPYQYGMRSADYVPTSPDWTRIFKSRPEDIEATCARGDLILAYQTYQDEGAVRGLCFETEIKGLKVLAANTGGRGSQFFDSAPGKERFDVLCIFSWRPFIGAWSISLYSTGSVDVGEICKSMGGGGHPGAGGFQAKELPFPLKGRAGK